MHIGILCSSRYFAVGIEIIGNKLFQYLHIHTSRVEELKVFCLFVEAECQRILDNVETDWL